MLKRAFLLIALLVILSGSEAYAKAPRRSVEYIADAIAVDHGWMATKQRETYAKALKRTAEKYDFDPLTGVALIWHESRWRAGAIGDNGRAIGLAQIHYEGICARDPSTCESVRQRLLDGTANIATMGRLIATMQSWCRKQTGKKPLLARWLHAYGYKQQRNLKCNMRRVKGKWKDLPVPTEVSRIIKYRRKLIRLLSRRKRKHR